MDYFLGLEVDSRVLNNLPPLHVLQQVFVKKDFMHLLSPVRAYFVQSK